MRYKEQFTLSPIQMQEALAKMRLYNGEIDGMLGPISRAAADAFARAWNLGPREFTDARFQRTIAFVTADTKIEEITKPLPVEG